MDDPDDNLFQDTEETGSDELLSEDHLRLPENASMLVRIHAMRAWLTRRQHDSGLEMGEAALNLQETTREEAGSPHLRRRERERLQGQIRRYEEEFQQAQQRRKTYEEAQEMLEECISHTTTGDRVLVEYYLSLEDMLVQFASSEAQAGKRSPRLEALDDVLHRVEQVSSALEE